MEGRRVVEEGKGGGRERRSGEGKEGGGDGRRREGMGGEARDGAHLAI